MKEKKSEHSPAPQPERAIYGFFLLVSSLIGFILFILVSVAPDSWLDYYELDFLPSKYWSLAVPAFIALATLLIVPIYCALNATRVNDLDAANSIRDELSLTRQSQTRGRKYTKDSIDPIYDIPIESINQFLFDPSKKQL